LASPLGVGTSHMMLGGAASADEIPRRAVTASAAKIGINLIFHLPLI
jgi:hypothetical protein